ncbi:putative sugar 1,4-lactone oxidase [Microdochium trichocladiopsis]|uniref:D-arabinono-1,4-lactone oxidase n=1 Tax=Microdochium trichocladiopsis TaxID=1682393 RepID=A0A9P8YEC4_9PEZI|nr:putative sugar 1,4-lactone oxidase [Microdochium trichocladiopsis]KAH7037446.1 putative sugar 1,4-lactone oxidase [Microdochium trichocladiopsis]
MLHPTVAAAVAGDPQPDVPFRVKPDHLHRTWAKTFASRPELYIQPESLDEIEKVTRLAAKCRRRVTTTGSGHSPSSLTCTSSWLVNLDRYNRILSLDKETNVVIMQSGIRLFQLCEELDKQGLAMPNLGSINEQSIAGVISTGTHGSSLRHGLVSEDILALRVTMANGTTRYCSSEDDPELFRAALLSLGAVGIITEVTFRAVPAYTLRWQQVVDTDLSMFNRWDKDLWTHAEFVRVWWFPYTRRAVTWSASKTDEPRHDPPVSYYDRQLGYYVYHNLLYLGHWFPRVLPWVEWFVFGMQYGFRNGTKSQAVQQGTKALLMNCLYSQFVNEWAIPLAKGPEFIRRMSSWLNHLTPKDPDYVPHGIPFSAKGLYVHAPVEVRVSNTSPSNPKDIAPNSRPLLDPTCEDGPTLYLNATLYRPYHTDPPCRARYYEAFEWLMREMGGRPHWAKNFDSNSAEIEQMYGEDLETWRKVRESVDPDGMFVGPWHRHHVMPAGTPLLPFEEVEIRTEDMEDGGVLIESSITRAAR